MVDLPQFVFPDLEVCQRCEGTNRVERPRSYKYGSNVHVSTVVEHCPHEGPDHVTYPPDERITLYETDALGYTVATKTWGPWPGRVEP